MSISGKEVLMTTKRNSIILLIPNYFVRSNFLVYEDKGWNTLFFPHITDEEQSDIEIEEILGKRFGAPYLDVKVKFLGEYSEQKPSIEHDNEIRDYTYKIYEADIANGNWHRLNVFRLDGLDYKWESLKRLKKDNNVKENNLGLVTYIEENLHSGPPIPSKKESFFL